MHVPSRRRQGGFTFIEILVVMGIITLLASMVVVLVPIVRERANKTKSKDNLRSLIGMLTDISLNKGGYPPFNGKNFTLSPIAYKVLDPESPGALEVFFSPGDSYLRLDKVSVDRYKELTKQKLKSNEPHNELTSYAGRKNGDKDCGLNSADQSKKGTICLCDDDDGPIHHPDGLAVGFTNGTIEMIDWEDLGMNKPRDPAKPDPFLGESASSDLLKCMSSSL